MPPLDPVSFNVEPPHPSSSDSAHLKQLLEQVAAGSMHPETALTKLKHFGVESVGDFANIDHHRRFRTGFPEFVWGAGKTPEQIVQIMTAMGQNHAATDPALPVVATLIEPEVFPVLQAQLPDLVYYPTARVCALLPAPISVKYPGLITVLTAGTSDVPVAEEAAVIAELSGFQVQRLWDVGVAGIQRLLNNLHVLEEADVIIVVAGMEGALPSVVGGLVDCPVIAVPTSIGYGASLNGISALLTMVNSCAAGIGVMNIDNGFGAAILAGKILHTIVRKTANK
ncbi:MAG: nickel pincer cofactor biosynthesis protein LarB [Symploca sp. SIO2B6]|nr:nickel pincer cofactor biosynthesis protein LarB [Symploca sp. SIO2B6]